MSIGKKVEELRKKIGITKVQLADYLMVDHRFISQVESGSRTLTVEMATKFAHLAGIEPAYFLDDSNDLECSSVQIDLSSPDLSRNDYVSIATINVIVKNLRWMNEVLFSRKN